MIRAVNGVRMFNGVRMLSGFREMRRATTVLSGPRGISRAKALRED